MDKKKIREDTLFIWKNMKNKRDVEQAMYARLFRLKIWKKANVIGLTHSRDTEWDTTFLIKKAWSQGKIITIPKSNPLNCNMQFYQYQQGDKLENVWQDIKEPIANPTNRVEKNKHDLIIVPGISFNKKGFRIGYGGGFYDRYLTDYDGQTLSLAANFQIQSSSYLFEETHDIPVDCIVTNFGTIYCNHT